MNRYRVLSAPAGWPGRLPFAVQTTDGRYEIGDEFDHEFSEEDEGANLASGLVEIVPRTYRVVGTSIVDDTPPGGTFEAAMTIGREALLLGSHIERVGDEPPAEPSDEAPAAEDTEPSTTEPEE